ncbi:hypothetical protein CWI84_11425 [Idiomarina tyrosinivorans]|uniref:diguanylate cyclase n=1 Tax=Idiomarina tyrosinivorans TaxID=1445662 RepID=A0A432ZFD5_9GAMM|nr:tetratricopeptide repeat-containing diguanylate cyclase [Idiomarina tyrosinivorans]RUO76600.1 hypothetical protein CWI84_11425 [Idiomarina tyrosinivorans]
MPAVDQSIEQQLDAYLNKGETDPDKNLAALNSIIAQMDAQTPVSTRVRALSYKALSLAYKQDWDAAFEMNERILRLAKQSEIPDAIAEAYANKIELLQGQGKAAEAYLLVANAELPLKDAKLPRVRYYVHNLISRIYANWNKYEEALTHLLAAQQAVAETHNSRTILRRQYLNLSIAQIQSELGQWQKTIDTASAAIKFGQQQNELSSNPDLWLLLAYAQTSLEQFEQAKDSLQHAIETSRQLNYPGVELTALNNFGDLYLRLGDYAKAKSYLNQALEMAQKNDDEVMVQTIKFNLGFIDVKQNRSKIGLTAMEEVLQYFKDKDYSLDVEDLLGEIAEAYALMGQYQKQADALMQRMKMREERINAEQQQNISQLQKLYDSKDKAQQIELLKKENELKQRAIEINKQQSVIWGLVGVVVVFAIILLLLMYRAARRANIKLKEANSQLANQSLRDPLTGLWNRRALQQTMDQRDQRDAQTKSQATDGLLLLDIDFFKRINDRLGHNSGDKVLIELSQRLEKMCRHSDRLVRWGGEEFLFYFEGVDNSSLRHIAQRVLETIAADPIDIDGERVHVSATCGYILLPFAGVDESKLDWERVLQLADMALYSGKAHGRNRACGITDLHVEFSQFEDQLKGDLSKAIDENWISMEIFEGPGGPTKVEVPSH